MATVRAGDGVELAIHEAGRADGRPALLLHGFSANAGVWASTAPALAPRFRVLSLDFRGHGGSGRTDDPADFTLERLASDVLEVADGVGTASFTLIGHGMGGEVAQLVALRAPARIEALVLVGTGAAPLDPTSGWARSRASIAAIAAERGMAPAWEAYVESGIVGWELDELPEEIVSQWRTEFMKTAPAAFVGLSRSMAEATDRTDALRALEPPTLVVAGADDAAFLDAARSLAAIVPGAQLEVIGEAGHSPQIMAAEEFNEILLAFLKRAVPAGRAS